MLSFRFKTGFTMLNAMLSLDNKVARYFLMEPNFCHPANPVCAFVLFKQTDVNMGGFFFIIELNFCH